LHNTTTLAQVDLWRWSFDGACWLSPADAMDDGVDNNGHMLTPTQRAAIQQVQHIRPDQ
jgi:hypothetical protein